jgi:uncharacterized protein YcbX
MTSPHTSAAGTIVSLWRYPVKSMQGEELNASAVSERGLLGDRAYALVDAVDGKIASAKNPRKWPHLFAFRAGYAEVPRAEVPRAGGATPPVRITLPDGTLSGSDQPDLPSLLGPILGRAVALRAASSDKPQLEAYWPDVEGLENRDTVTDVTMPAGTFFDLATVHLLTTATLDRLRELYPQGRFEVRRFRPNIVVAVDEPRAFVENDWVGRTLLLGSEVRLRITQPCSRCVMTTLPQSDLPADPGILRTAVKHNGGNVGVYATVVRGGTIRRGDMVCLE